MQVIETTAEERLAAWRADERNKARMWRSFMFNRHLGWALLVGFALFLGTLM